METIQQVKQENIELKKALAISMNKPLIKKMVAALIRIKQGHYIAEEEFFKDSPLRTSVSSHG